jgi:hypothetical protein
LLFRPPLTLLSDSIPIGLILLGFFTFAQSGLSEEYRPDLLQDKFAASVFLNDFYRSRKGTI